MAKLQLQGIIKQVGELETTRDNFKQRIVLFIPGWVDRFGQKKGKDEYWPIDIFGDRIDKFKLTSKDVRQMADVTVYLSGNEFNRSDGTGVGYAINCNLAELKLLGEPVNANGEKDDLPF